jgi:ATP dependent DNA ligase domain
VFAKARFIEPMLLLRTEKLPEGADWLTELKLDGYRALAIKTGGQLQLRSRNDNDFNGRYPSIVKALAAMPDDTVIDGEVVALDAEGRPSFNMLQNYGSAGAPLHFFIFDALVLKGRDVMGEPLVKRRALIEKHVLPQLADPIRYSPILEGSLKDLVRSVKAQGLEGLVAKRRDSKYEPGRALGRGPHGIENGGMPVADAGAGGAVRIRGMDGRRPPAAQPVYRAAGGQEAEGCEARVTPGATPSSNRRAHRTFRCDAPARLRRVRR